MEPVASGRQQFHGRYASGPHDSPSNNLDDELGPGLSFGDSVIISALQQRPRRKDSRRQAWFYGNFRIAQKARRRIAFTPAPHVTPGDEGADLTWWTRNGPASCPTSRREIPVVGSSPAILLKDGGPESSRRRSRSFLRVGTYQLYRAI